jgi:hypothetical protein
MKPLFRKGRSVQFTENSTSEAAILGRIVQPDQTLFSAEAARAILALDFSEADKEQMRRLSGKARQGTLTAREQAAINNYERVGHFHNILQLKARRWLQDGNANVKGKSKVP